MATLPLNPHYTVIQKIQQLENEVDRIIVKVINQTVTTDETFALYCHKLLLQDLYLLRAQGKTEWYPEEEIVHIM